MDYKLVIILILGLIGFGIYMLKNRVIYRLQIGKYKFRHPIIQAGMGVGITLVKMAIASHKNGVVPVVALVGTGYYNNSTRPTAKKFHI